MADAPFLRKGAVEARTYSLRLYEVHTRQAFIVALDVRARAVNIKVV